MFTFHSFRCVLSGLLVSFIAVTLLFPTVSIAQTQPVTVFITEVTDIELEIDGDVFISPGDLYAVVINGTKINTFADHLIFLLSLGRVILFPLVPWFLILRG